MDSTHKRTFVIYLTLAVSALAVCAWETAEHIRYRKAQAQTLIDRGVDITSTLGVVVRSQRRFGIMVSQERIQTALQDLARSEELKFIAILSANGDTIASAGQPVADLTPEMLRERGVYWAEHAVTIMNLMDLGTSVDEEGNPSPVAVVMPNDLRPRGFRPRPVPGGDGQNNPPPPPPPLTGRPGWMSKEEYDAVIQKKGVHGLVLSLSTEDMRQRVRSDLLQRSLISLLAITGALLAALVWRNLTKNAELQLRLVRAGQMNTHLKEMNLAAAGLAHETRNPLNLIRGLAQMIEMQSAGAPKLKESAAAIMEETDRLTVQLNQFISYSKPREPLLAPVDLGQLIANVLRPLRLDLEDKAIHVKTPETSLTVEADEPLLRQALFNLILNATQAVGAGGHIEIRFAPVSATEATLEIADDGQGVREADRAAIFKPYFTQRPGGVGLGLAIVHQIILAHGWEITCLENPPRGALFKLSHLKLSTRPHA